VDIQSKKIVVKIGSSVIVDGDKIDRRCLANLVKDIAYLIKEKNKDVVIVSSGAVACEIQLCRFQYPLVSDRADKKGRLLYARGNDVY